MTQRGHDARLPLQPQRRLGRDLGAMDALDRHLTLETLVAREEDRRGPS